MAGSVLNIKAFATLSRDSSGVALGASGRVGSVDCGAYRLMSAFNPGRIRPTAFFGAAALAFALAGCAQQPSGSKPRSSEFFPASKYGPASPRVVGEGQAVPRGGGRFMVGRPYTVAGKRFVPREVSPGFSQRGKASWYGAAFHGRRTANGEVYDMRALSAAHPTMPLPSYARVTNMRNNHSIIVRVNDRGPFHGGRVLDVSQKVAETLDFRRAGVADIKVEYIGRAGIAGSDDAMLIASLRTDGRPATLPPGGRATMIAQATPAPAAPAQQTVVRQAASQQTAAPARTARSNVAAADPPPASANRTTVVASAMQLRGSVAPTGFMGAKVAPTRVPVSTVAFAPLPPSRPLDLATIPGADTPIRAPQRRVGSGASFFAEPSPVASTLLQRGPFEGIDVEGLRPLR
jgi:rare lipoprotein A